MAERSTTDPIQPLDIAVVDQDLLWRVEMMNAVRPFYADDYADVVTAMERVHTDDPTVLLLGRNLIEQTPFELLEMRRERPNIAVVAIAGDHIRAGGMDGVDLVLPNAASDSEVVAAVTGFIAARQTVQTAEVERRYHEHRTSTDRAITDARLIVVTSAKGGVGRTTVALNLAVALAQQGMASRVALVETDPVYGDLAMMLGLAKVSITNEQVPRELTEDMVLEHCTFPLGDEPLDVVLPPRSLDPWNSMRAEDVRTLVGAVAIDHDWIVVDISPMSLQSTALAGLADRLYLVAPTELPGLKDATVLSAALRLHVRRPELIEVVMVDRVEHGRTASVVAEAAGAAVVATVPFDRKAQAANEEHRPLVDLHPRGAAAKALRKLATHTFETVGPPPTSPRDRS